MCEKHLAAPAPLAGRRRPGLAGDRESGSRVGAEEMLTQAAGPGSLRRPTDRGLVDKAWRQNSGLVYTRTHLPGNHPVPDHWWEPPSWWPDIWPGLEFSTLCFRLLARHPVWTSRQEAGAPPAHMQAVGFSAEPREEPAFTSPRFTCAPRAGPRAAAHAQHLKYRFLYDMAVWQVWGARVGGVCRGLSALQRGLSSVPRMEPPVRRHQTLSAF